IHCMVAKLAIADEPKLGKSVFFKLKQLFRDRLSASVMCEPWTKKWSKFVSVKYEDGTKDIFSPGDLITTNRARRIRAMDLVDKKGHLEIEAKTSNGIHSIVNK